MSDMATNDSTLTESNVGQLRYTLHHVHGYKSLSACTLAVWLNLYRLGNHAKVPTSWNHHMPEFCEQLIRRHHQADFNRTLP
jgi:diphthamide biosynthesis methyltransferase